MEEDAPLKKEYPKTTAENLADHLGDYAETYVKLGVVNATQKATAVATVTLTAILISVFCLFVLLFAGMGVALALGEWWGNLKAGYFAVAGFYVLCALLFMALRRNLIFPFVRDQIIRNVYE